MLSRLPRPILATALILAPTAAQSPGLVADLSANVPPLASSGPRRMVPFGNGILFSAARQDVGRALFISFGATSGARLVADLTPGESRTSFPAIVAQSSRAIVIQSDWALGNSLWVTDGTAAGSTRLVPFGGPYVGNELATNGSFTLFEGGDIDHGPELWGTDGTRGGTRLVFDVAAGSRGSYIRDLVAVGSRFYFVADDSITGEELWISDGSATGTRRVADIRTGPAGSFPLALTPFGNRLLFLADDGQTGLDPWITDGTAAGTLRLADVVDSPVDYFTPVGNRAWFTTQGPEGAEPWITDGTPAGTRIVADIHPGAGDSSPQEYFAFGGRVWFGADDGVRGRELWSSDGTAAGTRLERDIAVGASDSNPLHFAIAGTGPNTVLIFAATNAQGRELWRTDGTSAGTQLVSDIATGPRSSNPADLTALGNGEVLFSAYHPLTGYELWSSRGTAATTQLVSDIASSPSGSTRGSNFVSWLQFGNDTRFLTMRGTTAELWQSDGTARGTSRVTTVGNHTGLAVAPRGRVGNLWVFSTADSGQPRWWRTDGTTAGTTMIHQGTHGNPRHPGTTYAGRLWFAAGWLGNEELWVSDGTAAGTARFADLFPGPRGCSPGPMVRFRGRLLFAADSQTAGRELWITDGTVAGTRVLADIQPGPGSSQPGMPVVHGDYAYFNADNGRNGPELWRTDGTRAGTTLVADIYPGARASWASPLASLPNGLLLTAQDPAAGQELWISDGTAAGTQLLRDLTPGANGSVFQPLGTIRGRYVFHVPDNRPGGQTWSTDGTPAGTRMLPARGWFGPGQSSGQALWFAGQDAAGDRELWRTDGTVAGTTRAADISPNLSSNPEPVAFAGDRLLFTADDGVHGRELWQIEAGAVQRELGPGCAGPGRAAPRLTADAPVLGSSIRMTIEASTGSTIHIAVSPTLPLPVGIPGSCDLFLEPASLVVLVSFPRTSARHQVPLSIPNIPGLRGLTISSQAAVGPTNGPLGLDFTNGQALTFGR